MKFEEESINRKLQGSVAEQLFELLHFEIGCRVFRTGHEVLYPDLFNLANLKKRLHHKAVSEKDIDFLNRVVKGVQEKEENELKSGATIDIKQIVGQERFQKRNVGTTLAKSPDFTIVTPSGNILQFEVKYRYNGELSEEEKMKYLKSEVKPDLFVLMAIEPYIKILMPVLNIGIEEYSKAFFMLLKPLWEKYKKEHPNIPEEKLDKEFQLIYPEKIDELLSEHFRDRFIYRELKRKKDGSLRRDQITGLMTDDLIYTKEILEKYEKIIKNWFHNK